MRLRLCVGLAGLVALAVAVAQPGIVRIGVVTTTAGTNSVVPPGWQDASLSAADIESVAYAYNGQIVQIQLPVENQGGLAADAMLSPYGSAVGVDADGDGIVDARENALADKFAPVIFHDKDDLNLPVSVDWLLQRTSLEYYNNNGFLHQDDHIAQGGPPLAQPVLLGRVGNYSGGVVRSDSTRSLNRQHTFALLDVQNPYRLGSLVTSDWKTYTHVFRNYYGGISIQYWRSYAYNTGDQTAHLPIEIDHHGGDWEAVEVALDSQLKPVRYRFLGHTGSEMRLPNQVSMDGTHVKVFSEPGGHASHSSCVPSETIEVRGFHYNIWLNDLNQSSNVIRQETWSGGSVSWPSGAWRSHPGGAQTPSGGLVNMGEKTMPTNGQVFVKYSSLWGSLGSSFSGFWGPAYNETEMAKDGLITAWCYGMKASRTNVTKLRAECYPAATSE